jgi:hypothetical protein
MPQRHTPSFRVRHKLLHHHLRVLARRVVAAAAARTKEQVERGRVVACRGGGGQGGRDEGVLRGVGVLFFSSREDMVSLLSYGRCLW